MLLMTPQPDLVQEVRRRLASELDKHRNELRLTKKEYAQLITNGGFELDDKKLGKWIKGENLPAFEIFFAIAIALGEEEDFFFLRAGLFRIPTSTREMIKKDPLLDYSTSESTLAQYDAMVALTAKRRALHRSEDA